MILVLAEHSGEALAPATLNTVTAAQAIAGHTGGDITILVAGAQCAAAARAAAAIPGVARVWLADGPALAHARAEPMAAQLLAVQEERFTHILAPGTTYGKNILPRLAALLDSQQISEITAVIDAETFVRPIYAGNALEKVRAGAGVRVITVRGTAFGPAAAEGGHATVTEVPVVPDKPASRFVSRQPGDGDRPELTSAKIVISGGRGVGSAENFQLLHRVADRLNAAIGASRAAVDAGFVPNDMQVGQTGKVVAPRLYIAVGISGAIQHLAGMKDSKVIVAINRDGEAPIFQIADYGLVADLFVALPELEAALAG